LHPTPSDDVRSRFRSNINSQQEQRAFDADHDIASRQDSFRSPPPSIFIVIMAEAIHPSPRGITDRCALLL
jgi:hypothetical protein